MHTELVEEGRDGDVAGLLEGRQLKVVVGELIALRRRRQLAGPEEARQENLRQAVGVGRREEQQGVALRESP